MSGPHLLSGGARRRAAYRTAVLAGRVPVCHVHHDRADGGTSGHDYRSTATGAHASGAGRPRSACGRCSWRAWYVAVCHALGWTVDVSQGRERTPGSATAADARRGARWLSAARTDWVRYEQTWRGRWRSTRPSRAAPVTRRWAGCYGAARDVRAVAAIRRYALRVSRTPGRAGWLALACVWSDVAATPGAPARLVRTARAAGAMSAALSGPAPTWTRDAYAAGAWDGAASARAAAASAARAERRADDARLSTGAALAPSAGIGLGLGAVVGLGVIGLGPDPAACVAYADAYARADGPAPVFFVVGAPCGAPVQVSSSGARTTVVRRAGNRPA